VDAAQLLAVRGRGGGHDVPGVGAPGERAGADGLAVFPEPAVADQRHFRGEAEAGSVPDHVVAVSCDWLGCLFFCLPGCRYLAFIAGSSSSCLCFFHSLNYGSMGGGRWRVTDIFNRHVSATALVWFPTAKFLGPLRWWVPWKVQGAFAAVARLLGYQPLLEKYTPAAEWAKIQQAKKTV